MPTKKTAAKKAAPKAAKKTASKGAKKAAKPEAALQQVDPAEKAKADRQIKEGPYNAIRQMRKSGLTPAKAMAQAQKSR